MFTIMKDHGKGGALRAGMVLAKRKGNAAAPSRKPMSVVHTRLLTTLFVMLALTGCARQYSPRAPRSAQSGRSRLDATALTTLPLMYPPSGAVLVEGNYSAEPKTTLGLPHLAPSGVSPCSGGVPASATLWQVDAGTFHAAFRGEAIERKGLLDKEPTVLEVAVLHEEEGRARECLRVPIVTDPKTPEWSESPLFSIGYGVDLAVPFHSIHAVDAVPMFVVRMGPWIGPVRLRTELGIGGALTKNANPNLIGYSYRVGLLLDSMLVHAGRFGLGVVAGYDTIGISLGANVDGLSQEGAGFKGLIYGPRGGLSFALLPQTLPGPAFKARPDASSATFEILRRRRIEPRSLARHSGDVVFVPRRCRVLGHLSMLLGRPTAGAQSSRIDIGQDANDVR